MNATTVPAEIAAFATAVREALADLPADEVDELTEGLEADLSEAYAEDLQRELPDPVDYAAELRGAAGLPTPAASPGRIREIVGSCAAMGRDLEQSLRRSPAMAGVLDFLVTLRPAWWILRGWAAYQCIGAVFGFEGDLLPSGGYWFLLVLLVLGSVVVGLRQWPTWLRPLIWFGNVVAVVATVAALGQVPTRADLDQAWQYSDASYYDDGSGYDSGVGVTAGGTEVTNIFAYDAKGAPLTGVQLFDQDGRPIQTSVPGGNGCLGTTKQEIEECETPGVWTPTTLETGADAWNVYPMQMAESSLEDPTTKLDGAVPQDRPAPFIKVSAVLADPTADPTAKAEVPEKSR